eukprot:6213458-Pleurochrysis_carterae.AAC.2
MHEARCPSRDPSCPSVLLLISQRGVLSSSGLSRGSDQPREHARYPYLTFFGCCSRHLSRRLAVQDPACFAGAQWSLVGLNKLDYTSVVSGEEVNTLYIQCICRRLTSLDTYIVMHVV